MNKTPVAVDAMGGDGAPEAQVAGAARAVRAGLPVLLVGDEAVLRPLIPKDVDLPIRHTAEAVGMGEPASIVIRTKPDASVRLAAAAVKAGEACALVSCGNTGAVMAAALIELGRIPGVDRPAVTTVVPRLDGGALVILDLGANVDCRPDQLGQFAVMGQVFARDVQGIANPRIGLLSNGEEAGKGNALVQAATEVLAELPLNFVGQVEPTEAFRGACDVLVCDGFVGNVMLKSVEATVQIVSKVLKEEILRKPSAKFGAWLISGAFRRFRSRTEYAAIGGAQLLGVDGVVIVGHGRADAEAVASAIHRAHHCAAEHLSSHIGQAVSEALGVVSPT
jgi:glycerol-3-phosphate acyltransferase PlsX